MLFRTTHTKMFFVKDTSINVKRLKKTNECLLLMTTHDSFIYILQNSSLLDEFPSTLYTPKKNHVYLQKNHLVKPSKIRVCE